MYSSDFLQLGLWRPWGGYLLQISIQWNTKDNGLGGSNISQSELAASASWLWGSFPIDLETSFLMTELLSYRLLLGWQNKNKYPQLTDHICVSEVTLNMSNKGSFITKCILYTRQTNPFSGANVAIVWHEKTLSCEMGLREKNNFKSKMLLKHYFARK